MRVQQIAAAAALMAFASTSASAQSWGDAIEYAQDLELLSFGGSYPPDHAATYGNNGDVLLEGRYSACPGAPRVTTFGSDDDPSFYALNCTNSILVLINLNEFARRDDLGSLQSGLNDLDARMATLAFQTDASLKRLQADADRNTTGVAMSFAMSGAGDLAPGETVALSANWGTFGGRNGLAAGFAVRASDHVTFNGAAAFGDKDGAVGGRAGVRFSW